MIRLIYTFLIFMYGGVTRLASVFSSKASLRIKGLQKGKSVLSNYSSNIASDTILVHCASLGEYEQAKPLIQKFLKETNYFIIISFFSPSGYEDAEMLDPRCIKCYLPFDLPSKMNTFLDHINPKLVLITKNEWWWNMLHILKNKSIDTYLISATIRDSHYFIQYPLSFFKSGLKAFNTIFVIDDSSSAHLQKVYEGEIIVSGDTRKDQVLCIKNNNTKSGSSLPTVIYGSIWKEDLSYINEMIRLRPDYTHILYPHLLNPSNIEKITLTIPLKVVSNIESVTNKGVYLINAMGQLKNDYAQASIAYIGGGFGEGIHNILEAAVYEIPTIFGPNNKKSAEAQELLEKSCAYQISDISDLNPILEGLDKADVYHRIESELSTYFSDVGSATDKIFSQLLPLPSINK